MSQPVAVGHGAHTAWRLRKYKTILKLLPLILEKSNAQLTGTILVVLVAVAGSIGFGVVVDGYGLSHPETVNIYCPPPLIINADGCFRQVISTTSVNGKNTTVVNLVPAGTPFLPNGTSHP